MRRIFELERHECRWPIGRTEDAYVFCAEPVTEGRSWVYCAEHRAMAFAKTDKKALAATPSLEPRSEPQAA